MSAPTAGGGAGVPDPESSYNRSATLGTTGADDTPLRAAAGQGSPFLRAAVGQGSPFAGAPFSRHSPVFLARELNRPSPAVNNPPAASTDGTTPGASDGTGAPPAGPGQPQQAPDSAQIVAQGTRSPPMATPEGSGVSGKGIKDEAMNI